MNQTTVNPDKYLLLILPLIFGGLLVYLEGQASFFACSLVMGLMIYELMTYRYRQIYGLTGLKILSMPSLTFISFTVLIAIPAVYITTIKVNPQKYAFYFSILSFYVLFPLGLRLANIFYQFDMHRIKNFYKTGFVKTPFDRIFYELLIVLFSFSLLILFLYLLRVDVIPLFELLSDPRGYLTLSMLREESMKILPVTFIEKYLFAWLRDLFMPFGIISSLFLTLRYTERKYRILFFAFFIFGIINNSLTIAKAPTAALFLSIAALVYLKRNKISMKALFLSIIIVFAFPYFVLHFVTPPEFRAPSNLLNSMLLRVFVIPAEALYQYFDIFPDHHQFLYGRSSKLFSWLHDEGLFNVSNYVAKIWWDIRDTTGYVNVNYLGYFWADFGWVGVISSSFLIGFLIHFIYYQLVTTSGFEKNIIYVTIATITVMTFSFTFISSNFATILLTRGLLLILLFLYLFKIMKTKIYSETNTLIGKWTRSIQHKESMLVNPLQDSV